MKLSVKMWFLHARIPECTLLIIAKRAGLCLLINKQTIPSTEQPSSERCWGVLAACGPSKLPKAGLSGGRPGGRPGWAVGSWTWLLWKGCWCGKRPIPHLLNEKIQSTLSFQETVGCLLPCLVECSYMIWFCKWLPQNHRNHPFGLLRVTPLCGIMPQPRGGDYWRNHLMVFLTGTLAFLGGKGRAWKRHNVASKPQVYRKGTNPAWRLDYLQDLLGNLLLLAPWLSVHSALQSADFCTGTYAFCTSITLKAPHR